MRQLPVPTMVQGSPAAEAALPSLSCSALPCSMLGHWVAAQRPLRNPFPTSLLLYCCLRPGAAVGAFPLASPCLCIDNLWSDQSLETDPDLPPGWRKIHDSLGTYYWHVPTGTTQWQHPARSTSPGGCLEADEEETLQETVRDMGREGRAGVGSQQLGCRRRILWILCAASRCSRTLSVNPKSCSAHSWPG